MRIFSPFRSIHLLALFSALVVLSQAGHAAATLDPLYSFASGIHGVYPSSRLLDRNGTLYGATSSGGTFNSGTVFKLERPATPGQPWTLTTIYTFKGGTSDGVGPEDLTMGRFGDIYGTVSAGGPRNLGGVFKLTPPRQGATDWTEEILHFFTGPDGGFPLVGVTIGKHGTLYGTASVGGAFSNGVVFELDPPTTQGGTWTETTLYSFAGGADGAAPSCGLVIDRSGELYGTATYGGINNWGTIFRVKPSANGGSAEFDLLYSFMGGSDGINPYGGRLAVGKLGSLYGTTQADFLTRSTGGTVFQLMPPSSSGQPWVHKVIHQFGPGSPDGFGPESGVVINDKNVLLGTTSSSISSSAQGTVFSLTPPAEAGGPWTESIIYAFTQSPNLGTSPVNPVTIGDQGGIFGTTSLGGTNGFGNVFELK